MTDEDLLKKFEFLIDEGKKLEVLSKRLGIPFLDTGENYWEKINEAFA